MATKLRFEVQGDLVNNPALIVNPEGPYEAPNTYQLLHRYYYDHATDSIKDRHPGKTDRQVQELEHEAAIALALELGTTPPPPLPAA